MEAAIVINRCYKLIRSRLIVDQYSGFVSWMAFWMLSSFGISFNVMQSAAEPCGSGNSAENVEIQTTRSFEASSRWQSSRQHVEKCIWLVSLATRIYFLQRIQNSIIFNSIDCCSASGKIIEIKNTVVSYWSSRNKKKSSNLNSIQPFGSQIMKFSGFP